MKVKLNNNIAIVPVSLLLIKDTWQKLANTMPEGSILLYYFPKEKLYQKILRKVQEIFKKKGYVVEIIAV